MKKIILLLVLISGAFCSMAQTPNLVSTNNGTTLDTTTNTGARTFGAKVIGKNATVTIEINVTKISGTLGGTIIPVASNDGTNWYANGAGTFTVTDVTAQGVNFSVPVGWQYYGYRWTGTGTMAGSSNGVLLAK